MIAFLDGRLAHKDPASAIIDCNGVGYYVRISLNTYSKLGKDEERAKLFTHLAIREDAQELYGFFEMAEKTLFLQLIGIQGVGGNTALTILSSIPPKELAMVIEKEDLNRLKAVKGIGVKTAGRIILELKGKLVTEAAANAIGATPYNAMREEAITALVNLGLPRPLMEKRIDTILKAQPEGLTVERLIREGLKQS
jgi:holliday junction DNA helicase RuvA